jgi:UDP-N-acetylglucosamine 2-epimerase (non-hydrolysing)
MVVIGTRPEAIKMVPVIGALRQKNCETIVCVTAQHRELLDQVLETFEIRADIDFNIMQTDQSPANVVVQVMDRLSPVIDAHRPDWLLVQGDTMTTAASAWAAFLQGTQIGHVEAGLRTHCSRSPFPEEINRRITSVLADLHFAPTQRAVQNLLGEGVPARSIFLTGNTSVDALSAIVKSRVTFADSRLEALEQPFVIVTTHRRENFGTPLHRICKAVSLLSLRFPAVTFVFVVHPNPAVQQVVHDHLDPQRGVLLVDPVAFPAFVHLMKRARCILTDSGGIQEEGATLGVPVLILRDITERPEAVESGWAELIGTSYERIVTRATEYIEAVSLPLRSFSAPFGDGAAGLRIAEVLTGGSETSKHEYAVTLDCMESTTEEVEPAN